MQSNLKKIQNKKGIYYFTIGPQYGSNSCKNKIVHLRGDDKKIEAMGGHLQIGK